MAVCLEKKKMETTGVGQENGGSDRLDLTQKRTILTTEGGEGGFSPQILDVSFLEILLSPPGTFIQASSGS